MTVGEAPSGARPPLGWLWPTGLQEAMITLEMSHGLAQGPTPQASPRARHTAMP